MFLEDEFNAIRQKFLDEYWNVFEPIEENKLIYTNIFNEYVSVYNFFIYTQILIFLYIYL